MINKQQKRNLLIGLPMVVVGSVLFWILMSKNTNQEFEFLKPTYFICIIMIPTYFIIHTLSEKFKTEKETKQKIKIAVLLVVVAIVAYSLIIFFLKKF